MDANKSDIAMPPIKATFKKAEKVAVGKHEQPGLL